MRADLSPKSIFLALLTIIGVLLLGNCVGIFLRHFTPHDFAWGLVRLFNFDTERSLPSFFSSMVILGAGLLLFVVARQHRRRRQPAVAWYALGALFLFLSFDEVAALHERLIVPMREIFDAGGIFYYAWVIPYGAVLFLLGAIYLPFMMRLSRRTLGLFLSAGGVFVSGAIGVEFIGGSYAETHGTKTITYALIYTAEELLEKLGMATFVYALLDYMVRQFGPVLIGVRLSEPVAAMDRIGQPRATVSSIPDSKPADQAALI